MAILVTCFADGLGIVVPRHMSWDDGVQAAYASDPSHLARTPSMIPYRPKVFVRVGRMCIPIRNMRCVVSCELFISTLKIGYSSDEIPSLGKPSSDDDAKGALTGCYYLARRLVASPVLSTVAFPDPVAFLIRWFL